MAIGRLSMTETFLEKFSLISSPSPFLVVAPTRPATSIMKYNGMMSAIRMRTSSYLYDAPLCIAVITLAASTSAIMTSHAGPKTFRSSVKCSLRPLNAVAVFE